MRGFVIAAVLLMTTLNPISHAAEDETVITDFTSATADLRFYVVNDNVMGGRSDGDFSISKDRLRFRGRTNTDGGGFSSIRSHPLALDLSVYDGIRLRVRGDGRRYTLRLTTLARWHGRNVAYWAAFDTADGEWAAVEVPFTDFIPTVRGMAVEGPGLDATQVTGLGLMIYDGRDGRFDISVDRISAYSTRPPFSLDDFRWQHRLLVVSVPGGDDENLGRLLDEIAATADEFADRDLVLVMLQDDGVSTTGERVLIPGEVEAVRKALALRSDTFGIRLIGKDGTVKLASESSTPMAEIYALIDTMPMRRQEQSRP